MPTLQATYSGQEIEVIFSGTAITCDFGVERSPVWEEVEDIKIESLAILGNDVAPYTLPPSLRIAIEELSSEVNWST